MDFLISLSRGLLGIVVLLGVCYLFSSHRSRINWRLVFAGIGLQIVLALLILKVGPINAVFSYISGFFRSVLEISDAGAAFLFGPIATDLESFGVIFAFRILPTIIFFSALSSILYYFGILQKVIYGLAYVMRKALQLTGAEALAAAANVFIGQTEAPLVVRPYLERMTRSEIFCLMTGGMATIAGGVFAAFIGMLDGKVGAMGIDFAQHLLTASIISAPAAIVAAKIILPETEPVAQNEEAILNADVGNNLLDAISRGTTDGLKLAVNVGAMLLVFVALIYMLNLIFMGATDGVNYLAQQIGGEGVGDWNAQIAASTDGRFEGFSFTYLLGLLGAPIAWLIGTPTEDIVLVGQLLGQKTVLNEFVAYAEFGSLLEQGVQLQPKSIIIATYALCGFSNFASIGIQIGGIGAIAPGKRKSLTELGLRALLGGSIACFLTAAVAGVIV